MNITVTNAAEILENEDQNSVSRRERVLDAAPSLATLLRNPAMLVPPKPIIPNLAWRGRFTLLSAREKVGKSTFVGQAVAALTSGEAFLGVAGEIGTVLWIGMDEDRADICRRLSQYGADPDRVFIRHTIPTMPELRDMLEELRPDVVVIDNLAILLASAHCDENESSAGTLVHEFVALTRQYDCALVMIHHSKKNGREYRGHSSIGGAVDQMLDFFDPSKRIVADDEERAEVQGSTKRTLRGVGRMGHVNVTVNYEDGWYSVLSESEVARAPLGERLVTLIATHPGRSATALRELAGVSDKAIGETLRSLLEARRIEKEGAGRSTKYFPVVAPGLESLPARATPVGMEEKRSDSGSEDVPGVGDWPLNEELAEFGPDFADDACYYREDEEGGDFED